MVALASEVSRPRYAWLDLARGYALVAMAIYHFVWDLSLFGLVDPETPFEWQWKLLARATAGSFLFLAGIGLVITHRRGVRWGPFLRRLAMILLAAGVITAATRLATPNAYIFFGILHMIAVGSVAGLVLLPFHWSVAIGVGALAAWAGLAVSDPIFDQPALWWTGLGTQRIISNDFVPFFPAFAAVAAGISVGKYFELGTGSDTAWASLDGPLDRWLRLAGRHSLLVYLLHQPVLIGLLYVAVSARSWLERVTF